MIEMAHFFRKKIEKNFFRKKQKNHFEVPSRGTCSEIFRSVGLLVWPGASSQKHTNKQTNKQTYISVNKGITIPTVSV